MQIVIPGLKARYSHSATAFTLAPGLTDVILFGGCSQLSSKDNANYSEMADTTVLRFIEPTSLVRLIGDLVLAHCNIIFKVATEYFL